MNPIHHRRSVILTALVLCGHSIACDQDEERNASPEPGEAGERARSGCAQETTAIERAEQLRASGRLLRALRALDRAEDSCPASVESGRLRLAILVQVGELEQAKSLADELLATPSAVAAHPAARDALAQIALATTSTGTKEHARALTEKARVAMREDRDNVALDLYLEAWATWHPNPEALLGAAAVARRARKPAEAQRFDDRALVEVKSLYGAVQVEESWRGRADLATYARGANLVAVARGDTVHVARVDGDEQDLVRFGGHGGVVAAMAFSPDGARLAVGDHHGGLRLWETATARLLSSTTEPKSISAIGSSFDGKLIAVGRVDGSVALLDAATLRARFTRKVHTKPVTVLSFSPDGARMASGSQDALVVLWNLDEATSRVLRGHGGGIYSAVFSPSGSHLASGSGDRTCRLWSCSGSAPPKVLSGFDNAVLAIGYSNDGTRVVPWAGPAGTKWFDVSTGTEVAWTFAAGSIPCTADGVNPPRSERPERFSECGAGWIGGDGESLLGTCGGYGLDEVRLGVSTSGRRVEDRTRAWAAASSATGTIAMLTMDGEVRTHASPGVPARVLRGSNGSTPRAFGLSGDGSAVAVGTYEGVIEVWLTSGARTATFKGTKSPIEQLAVGPDGSWVVATARDGAARLWKRGKDTPAWTAKLGKDRGTAIAVSPDGQRIAVGTTGGAVLALDENDGKRRWVASAGGEKVEALAFSAGGETLAAASDRVRFWNAADGAAKEGFEAVELRAWALAFHPSGRFVVAIAANGVHLLPLESKAQRLRVMWLGAGWSGVWVRQDGAVEPFGEGLTLADGPCGLRCTVAHRVFPFSLCADAHTAEGLFAEALTGEPARLPL